jgi:hypothetical protein
MRLIPDICLTYSYFRLFRTRIPRREKRKCGDVFDDKPMISRSKKRSRLSLHHSLTSKHESSPPCPEKRKREGVVEDEDTSNRRKRSRVSLVTYERKRKCVQGACSNKRRRTNMNIFISSKHCVMS